MLTSNFNGTTTCTYIVANNITTIDLTSTTSTFTVVNSRNSVVLGTEFSYPVTVFPVADIAPKSAIFPATNGQTIVLGDNNNKQLTFTPVVNGGSVTILSSNGWVTRQGNIATLNISLIVQNIVLAADILGIVFNDLNLILLNNTLYYGNCTYNYPTTAQTNTVLSQKITVFPPGAIETEMRFSGPLGGGQTYTLCYQFVVILYDAFE